jgi:hypothetical protein
MLPACTQRTSKGAWVVDLPAARLLAKARVGKIAGPEFQKLNVRAGAIIALGVVAFLGVDGWLSDFVTAKGEATVYTAECEGGSWQGAACTGHLAAGDRYRFHAVKARGEVLYWTSSQSGAVGKLQDCEIRSGRNWRCKSSDSGAETITFELAHGMPVRTPDAMVVEAHPISKERWYLIRIQQSMKRKLA